MNLHLAPPLPLAHARLIRLATGLLLSLLLMGIPSLYALELADTPAVDAPPDAEAPAPPDSGLSHGLEEWQGDPGSFMVAIEILVVEVKENRTRELGLDYGLVRGAGSGSVIEGGSLLLGPPVPSTSVPTFSGDGLGRATIGFESRLPGLGVNLVGMDVDGHVFSAKLRALLEQGDARITSRPIVLALHGTPASISVGSEIPYQDVRINGAVEEPVVAFENVGVKMEIVPVVVDLARGALELDVRQIEVSSVSNFITVRQVDRPVFETAGTRTRITMHSGETIQMSSLKGRRSSLSREGIPVLMHIPLIKHLFSSRKEVFESVDILFFLTPHLVPPGRNLLVPYDFAHGKDLVQNGVELPAF
jgi:type II secretory pathway component GspD/PulD (secretin)